MEEKRKTQTTKRNIIIAILLAFIIATVGTTLIFSNNGTLQSSNGSKDGTQKIGETSGEVEIASGVENYKATVIEESVTTEGKKKFIITNKYNGPVITAEKTVQVVEKDEAAGTETKKNYEGYVVEGTELEYTIIARNAGEVEKTDLLIKDTIPAGVTFVDGSIKVNGNSNYKDVDLSTKTADDLKAGIMVDVPAKSGEEQGETRLTLRVTVDNLEGDSLQQKIKNVAVVGEEVPEQPEVEIDVKKAKIIAGKSAVINGNETKTTVEKGDEITYTIKVENTGEAKATVHVSDTVPTHTVYKENSLQVKTVKDGNETADATTMTIEELAAGVDIEVDAKETKKIIFTVTVEDTDNDIKINNVATVGEDKPGVEHTYIEPVIDVKKTVTTEDGTEIKAPDYVLEGQKIKYRIVVTNTGSKETVATIKDTIPEGLTFVANSITVNSEAQEAYGETDLASGIQVNVPAKTETAEGTVTPGQVVLEFKVEVNELGQNELGEKILTKTIGNTAAVAENGKNHSSEVDVTVNKPDLKSRKTSSVGTDEKVKAGDEITYTIELDNSKGTAPTTATVKDTAPKGTTFKDVAQIMRDTEVLETKTEDQLKAGIEVELAAGETKKVVFIVVVGNKADATEEEKVKDGDKISNTANVNGEDTETTEDHYVEPIITSKKEVATEKNLGYVVKGEKVTYTITVENAGGLEKSVKIQDTISDKLTLVEGSIVVKVNGAEIETEKDLAAGITVTVPEKVGETNGKVEVIFVATVNDDAAGDLTNTAIVDGDKPAKSEDVPVVKFEKTAEINRTTVGDQTVAQGKVTAKDEITYKIKVRNSGTGTAETIEVKDTVPAGTTLKENTVSDNGNVEDNRNITWTITNLAAGEEKELSFTVVVDYSEKDRTIENTAYVAGTPTDKTTTDYKKPAGRVDDEIQKTGTEKITKEDQELTYNINYTAKVNDYVGDAVVTVTDTLPYAIDETKSDLTALGEKGTDYNYDADTHTITFTNTVTGIDTYTNGEKTINISKEIKVVYVNMDYSKTTFDNVVKGKMTLKYLDDEEPVDHPEVTATVTTTTEFRTEVEVTKKWNHTNNIYGKPTKVVIQLLADGVVTKEQELTEADKVEQEEAENAETWRFTFTDLPKYDDAGNEIDYTVSEKE